VATKAIQTSNAAIVGILVRSKRHISKVHDFFLQKQINFQKITICKRLQRIPRRNWAVCTGWLNGRDQWKRAGQHSGTRQIPRRMSEKRGLAHSEMQPNLTYNVVL
jgi:hypothetical protein